MRILTERISGPYLFLFLILFSTAGSAQVIHPEAGFVFDDSEVPRIDLKISQSNLQALYADPESNMEYYAMFTFTRGDSTEGPMDVAVRLRGDTIRHKQKKSFRISFNSYDSNNNYHGIEKMDLNADVNDPSLLRSKLGWELFRYLGVPGARSNHVLLYINNEFFGVYLNREHMDERFVKSRFDNNDGNLYRGLWPADLSYLGSSQEDYKFKYDGRRVYALRTNEDWDDYEDLAGFITILDQYSGEELKAELEPLFNVQQYLKALAVEVMSGHWDGYAGDKNNYFLYRDQVSGRFEYLPYRLENSFGIDFRGVDWSLRSIYDWNLDLRPLYEKILEVEEYRAQYSEYIHLLAVYMTSAELETELSRWSSKIRDAVANDTFYSMDYGFTLSDFDSSMHSAWGEHVDYGVLEFLTARSASALAEVPDSDAMPMFSFVRAKTGPDRISLEWTVEDDDPGFSTSLFYRFDGGEWNQLVKDVPAEIDPLSGVRSYRDSIRIPGDTAEVELYFTVLDQAGQENRYPDTSLVFSYPARTGPLYINEFSASNSSTKQDEFGEYDDWAEVFNASDQEVWLADYHLSDKHGSPGKYRFPEQYIQPGGFYLVWLDDQEEQGENHATFKIRKEGELLRLSGRPSTGYQIVDSISFGLQETDVSLGRLVDGGPEWIHFPSPTPNYSNLSTSRQEIPDPDEPLSIYPNPASEGVIHFNRQVSGTIFNLMGQPLMELKFTSRARIPHLGEGYYIFRSKEGEVVQFIVTR
jgi:hypothetical protein